MHPSWPGLQGGPAFDRLSPCSCRDALAAQTDARHWSTDDQRGGPAQWSVSNEEATRFRLEAEGGG